MILAGDDCGGLILPGKLDVRGVAASLPEIADLEPIDEPTDREHLDGAIDEADAEDVAA